MALHFFPNPVDDILFLEIKNAPQESAEIQLYNQLGQLLMTKNIDLSSASPIFFEVKEYEAGVYFVKMKLENRKELNGKFVVF